MNTPLRAAGLRSVLAVAGVLLLSSCTAKVDTNLNADADPAAIAAKLTQLDDDWSKAAATRNAETVGSFYAADAMAYPPGENLAVGQAAATKVWAAYFADSTFSISWKTTHAAAAKSGEMGYTAGTYEDSYRGPDGATVHEKGKYLCVWAKQADGSWKAVHDMWNSDAK